MFTDALSLAYFLELQTELKPTISIEVGAFDADFSIEMANAERRGFICKAYAFEGSKPIFERYKDILEQQNVTYINKIITDYEGTAEFLYDSNSDIFVGHNGIKTGRFDIKQSEVTECTTLDLYFRDLKDENIALWIDCEGANREVLTGATRILSMCSSIYIEVEQEQLWQDAWLIDDVVRFLSDMGFVLKKSYQYSHNQSNLVFTRD
jgi:FkbM family methyltransferase